MRRVMFALLPFLVSSLALAQGATPLTAQDYSYQAPGKAFQFQIPSDWEQRTDYAGYALFLTPKVHQEATAETPVVADPILTVSVVREPQAIDEEGLEEFGKELSLKLSQAGGAEGLQLFQKSIVSVNDGRKGLLYYLTFRKGSYDMMSAVLVVSNTAARYRVQLTDFKESFNKNLEKYFSIMSSIAITGDAPVRETPWDTLGPFVLGGVGALVALLVLGRWLSSRSRNQDAEHDDGGSAAPRSANSGHLSGYDSGSSRESRASSRSGKSKASAEVSTPPSSAEPSGFAEPSRSGTVSTDEFPAFSSVGEPSGEPKKKGKKKS